MQVDRMNNPKYVNWVKVGTALHYVKEGLSDFVNKHSNIFHGHIKAAVLRKCVSPPNICNACTSKRFKTKQDKNRPVSVTKWSINCVNDVCNHWCDEILAYHSHGTHRCPTIHWPNIDPLRWPNDPWEVIKTFQPHGCHCHRSADDSDCSALLGVLLDCTYFHQFLSNLQLLREIKDHRNEIMHSGNLEIEDSQCRSWLDDMIRFLEDPVHFSSVAQCQQSATKIKELRDNQLELTLCKELEENAIRQLTEQLRKDVQQLQAQQEVNKSSADDVKGVQDELIMVQSQLQQCHDMSSRIAYIEGLLPKDGFEFSDIKSAVKILTDTYARNTEELSTWQKQIETDILYMRKDIADLKQKNDEDIGQTVVDIDDIRQRLIMLYLENCDEVPFYPLSPEQTGKIQHLYVKPCMRSHFQQKVVNCYQDIFSASTEAYKNIFIIGEAGIGKSTFCDYMVNAWCCAHSNKKGYHNYKDIQTMASFPLLFYISLRYASPGQSIEEMITNQLIDVDVSKVLNNNCLILLDGLDEWTAAAVEKSGTRFHKTSLPQMTSTCACTVITTSRPWKVECLRLGNNEKDREIHIDGLNNSSTTELATLLIDALNKLTQANKDVKDFLAEMQRLKIEHFLKFPILLKQMVCLWYDEVALGNSQCEIYSNVIKRQLQLANQKDIDTAGLINYHNSSSTSNIPRFLDKLTNDQTHKQLLFALSKMAFHTLFSKRRESALVFDHDVTRIHGMSDEEVKACLRIGLLSQKQLYGKITERNKSLNFIHKSNQEYFSALYLSSVPDSMVSVKEICTTLQMMQEIEHLVHFVSGMNTDVCKELTVHLQHVALEDPFLKQYRENAEVKADKGRFILQKIQRMVLELITESAKNDEKNICLPIGDVIINESNIKELSSNFNSLDISYLVSVHIMTSKELEQEYKTTFESILNRLSHLKCLRKIILEDPGCCLSENDIVKIISNSKENLKSLQLHTIDLSGIRRPQLLERMFSGTPIYLMLKQLSLLSLSLANVHIAPDELSTLSSFLSQTTKLKELNLRGNPFTVGDTKCSIDLRKQTNIEHLSLCDLHLDTIQISSDNIQVCSIGQLHKRGCTKSVLECISNAPMLKQLECEKFLHPEDKDALVKALPTMEMLEHVMIRETNFEDRVVTLSPKMKNLKVVSFFKVSILSLALKHLLDKLPPQSVRIELDMVNLISPEGAPHVPQYIRQRPEQYKIVKCARLHDDDNKWLISFDKLCTEDTSQTWV